MDGRFIRIDDQCRTSMRGVYAIGDVTGEPMLAHRAMAQGEMVAEIVAGHKRSWDKRSIPAVCFTDPEVVTAGLSPDEARSLGREIKIGQFPFSANGRAMTMLGENGFVRAVARADNHLVLGIQAVGHGVSELATALGLRWKWARGWRTSPARSTRIQLKAKVFRKRPSRRSATPCTSESLPA